MTRLLLLPVLFAACRFASAEPSAESALRPRSPAESLRAMETSPGFRVGLVAAEPLVMDPVAFDWGPDGRLWVVEMADYPLGLDDKGKPGGRVRFLRDTDGDGRYDQSTLFAEALTYPSGITAWREGVLVTTAPNLWYLEDTDGDGRADRKEAWFTGFGEGNQQHRVNGLVWGLDNWLYVANGDSGGAIRSAKTGRTVNINGRDLRIRPDTGEIEAVTGQTQHGRGRDDWGNWWGANNSTPMYQFILDDHYLRRNPHLAPPDPRINVATLGNSPLHPISYVLSHWSGYKRPPPGRPARFTSACGTMVYRDTLLGEAVSGNMFVSEPVHNLVHRRVIDWEGLRMTSRKPAGEEGREFLRSRDSWFRPTLLRSGPDGGLWVADMYRLVIEHPKWIADDVEKTLELRAGHDKGRIYRVLPEAGTPRAIPDFDGMSTAQLVELLAAPSGWTRDMAHRILLWRADRAAPPLLARAARSDVALQRLHALCVLDGLNAVTPAQVTAAMQDRHPGVRRHAVRIAERFAAGDAADAVVAALAGLSGAEGELQVLKQIAYSLGAFDHPRAGRALGALLARHRGDTYLTAAGLSSIARRTGDVAAGARAAREQHADAVIPIEPLMKTALGKKDRATVAFLVAELLPGTDGTFAAWQFKALAEIERTLRRGGQSLSELVTGEDARARLRAMARRTLLDAGRPHEERRAALGWFGNDPAFRAEDGPALKSLLAPGTPPDLQGAAMDAICAQPDDALLRSALANWGGYDPLSRDRFVGVLSRRTRSAKLLLDALKTGTVAPLDINAHYRQTLLHHRDPAIAKTAAGLLRIIPRADRQKLIDAYVPVVRAGGDARRGSEHFNRACVQCHKMGGLGYDLGPSLAGLLDTSPEFLTTHILDPNRAIEDKYRIYLLNTVDGEQWAGMLLSETATSVTLGGVNDASDTILKKHIEPGGFVRGQLSMMPEGLEAFLDPQAMADVVAYIRANQEPPKSFPGNRPRPVEAEQGGKVLRLHAAHAEIYGKTLVFESKYKNLGYWQSADDRARWTVNIPAAGDYDVYLDWALDAASEGNGYRLRFAGPTLEGPVASTGSWDRYRRARIGTVRLEQGRQQVLFQSAGKPQKSLIDLRELSLVPAGHPAPE